MKSSNKKYLKLKEELQVREISEFVVKDRILNYFGFRLNDKNNNDHREKNILFEFKKDVDFSKPIIISKVLSQSLYYVRKNMLGLNSTPPPSHIILIDKNEAIITPSVDYMVFLSNDSYDWNKSASNPDPRLVSDIEFWLDPKNYHKYNLLDENEFMLFSDEVKNILNDSNISIKKQITHENFESAYEVWCNYIGKYIPNINKAIYFILDIRNESEYIQNKSEICFYINNNRERYSVEKKDYNWYWDLYEKESIDAKTIQEIVSKKDRLDNFEKRRPNGEYYTPRKFSSKAIDLICSQKIIPEDSFLWDYTAGTGNLVEDLVSYDNVFLSTIDDEEVQYMKELNLFPGATIFQYDYLNDDVDLVMNLKSNSDWLDDTLGWKLPRKLRECIVFKNRLNLNNYPYGEAKTSASKSNNQDKKGITNTKVSKYMKKENLGECVNEIFVHFLFRQEKERNIEKENHLVLFSTMKYINSQNNEIFRDKIFRSEFLGGFLFNSKNFNGIKTAFPIIIASWNLNNKIELKNQEIKFEILDDDAYIIGESNIDVRNSDEQLNKWVKRPRNTEISVPLHDYLNVHDSGLDKLSKNSIGFCWAAGNDISQKGRTGLFSSSFWNSHGWSITSENFEKSMVIFAVRVLSISSYISQRNQYYQPNKQLSQDFINDSVIFSLFNTQNNTSELKDVEYNGEKYDIKNEFFPFTVEKTQNFKIKNPYLYSIIKNTNINSFVSNYLIDKNLSKESLDVYEIAQKIYELYYITYPDLSVIKFKLKDCPFVGWRQISESLKDSEKGKELFDDLKDKLESLKVKLISNIYDYGFLSKEIIYEII